MFDCQLAEALRSVFGTNFLRISSVTFSRGSVVVNSVVRLAARPSDDVLDSLPAGVSDTFARNGFVIDQFSFEHTKGIVCPSVRLCVCHVRTFCQNE